MYYYLLYELQWYYQNLKKENIVISIICLLSFYALYLIVESIGNRKRNANCVGLRGFCFGLLAAYLYFVMYYTVIVRSAYEVPHYNLELFWSYRKALEGSRFLLVEILLNCVLLLPEGVLIPVLLYRLKRPIRFLITFVLGLLTTSAIELSQLYFKRGLFEFDDIFNNMIGVLVGYFIYFVIRSVWNGFRKLVERNKKIMKDE